MDLLRYTFFQHALLGSLLASIACGIIGTYIVTRRLVFISGGITHASFGGIGLGLFAGISPILSAAVFSVLSAFGVEWKISFIRIQLSFHCFKFINLFFTEIAVGKNISQFINISGS